MTDERYMQWKDQIAEARRNDDHAAVAKLQLDYNLELGECLAHQSQRTKEIKAALATVQGDVTRLCGTVDDFGDKISSAVTSFSETTGTVDTLSNTVDKLVAYHHDLDMKQEGVKVFWRVVSMVGLGIATITGWAYAIYQAVKAF